MLCSIGIGYRFFALFDGSLMDICLEFGAIRADVALLEGCTKGRAVDLENRTCVALGVEPMVEPIHRLGARGQARALLRTRYKVLLVLLYVVVQT